MNSHRSGRTTPERIRYNKFSAAHAHLTSNLQPDNGERAPLQRVDGLKPAMTALRESKRLNKSWTPAEREAVRRLIVTAREARWTWREMSRQLGITDTQCIAYWRSVQEGSE